MRTREWDHRYASRVDALERALRATDHLSEVDSPLIVEAFDMARILDTLVLGRNALSGRLDIIRLNRRYEEILTTLGIGWREARALSAGPESKPEDQGAGLQLVDPLADLMKEAGLG